MGGGWRYTKQKTNQFPETNPKTAYFPSKSIQKRTPRTGKSTPKNITSPSTAASSGADLPRSEPAYAAKENV